MILATATVAYSSDPLPPCDRAGCYAVNEVIALVTANTATAPLTRGKIMEVEKHLYAFWRMIYGVRGAARGCGCVTARLDKQYLGAISR